MFSSDQRTYDGLKKLWGLSMDNDKQVLVWVGAGAGSLLGYERWADLVERFHRSFLRAESSHPRGDAARELKESTSSLLPPLRLNYSLENPNWKIRSSSGTFLVGTARAIMQ